ncbi:MAG: TlpA family protein disulfide reductase [Ferruginibacter sp.]|nr:TlpA family protein disulfide reductase [Bacteroidota bacterium]MBX2919285.1 TlpA family protein disulfide reductase [Ferruginibacter sp.]MCC6636046.1 TlpA family protein disulfide reductase [Chitinophagaceae bacterium]
MNVYKIYLVILFSILYKINEAQNKFEVAISFPASINLNKISIEYYNGKETILVKSDSINRQVLIHDMYYTDNPILMISYIKDERLVNYPNRYLLKEKSKIVFNINSSGDLVNEKLINAIDFKDAGERQFDEFAKKELKAFNEFLLKNVNYLNDSLSLYEKYLKLDAVVKAKKLMFIKSYSNLYYSFWVFKNEFVSNTDYNAKRLLNIYGKYFSNQRKNTFEGKLVLKILQGRINSVKGRMAPLFTANDIKGNVIELKKFRNKYVILNFWASWCKPCVAEMPALDSIYKYCSKNKIAIISVSQDQNKENCLKAIQKYQMNWMNIFNDPMVNNAYGNNPALPQVYLIDKTGKIIYSRTDDKDYDLNKLIGIVKKLGLL